MSELADISREGVVPAQRLKDGGVAGDILAAIVRGDELASQERARAQALLDGEPPFNQKEREELGQGNFANFNDNSAAAMLEAAVAPFIELPQSVPYLAQVRTGYGSQRDQAEFSEIISEEFHRTIEGWHDFSFRHELLARYFVKDGLGVAYFPNETTPFWEVAPVGEFRIPKDTKASESEIEICFAETAMHTHRLYSFIRDEARATAQGWNPDLCRQAIGKASSELFHGDTNWEKIEEALKNQDYGLGYRSKKVHLAHCYVREYPQEGQAKEVSHGILCADNSVKGWLYFKPRRFTKMEECFVVFTSGVGNGHYASIRGLAYKIFNAVTYLMQMRLRGLDMAQFSSSAIFQAQTMKAAKELQMLVWGPMTVISPGLTAQQIELPDVSRNALPMAAEMQRLLATNTGAYQTQQATPDNRERTRFEVMVQEIRAGVLTNSAMNLYYEPLGRLLRIMFRRLNNPNVTALEPGGPAIIDFRKRCLSRGVPAEALAAVYQVDTVRAAGNGSPALQARIGQELIPLLPYMDEVGRNRALRQYAATLVGYREAGIYFPKAATRASPPLDTAIAEIENAVFRRGEGLPVFDSQLHALHLDSHLPPLVQLSELLGQNGGQVDPQAAYAYFGAALPHVEAHLSYLSQDPSRQKETGAYLNAYKLAAARFKALSQQMQQALQAQAEAMKVAPQGGQPTVEQQQAQATLLLTIEKLKREAVERERTEVRTQMDIEKHRSRMADVQQRMAIRDVTTADKLHSS